MKGYPADVDGFIDPTFPVQVGESVFHTERWVTPMSEELFNLRPREEMVNQRFGLLRYLWVLQNLHAKFSQFCL